MNNFQIQTRLKELGFYQGEINGDLNQSRESIRNFQRTRNLTPDGIVGPITRRALQENSFVVERDITKLIMTVNPGARRNLVDGILPFMRSELERINVLNSNRRLAAFLGQTSIECAYYRTLREFGDIAYFERMYGHRTNARQTIAPRDRSKRGDLKHWYIGRGIIQLTWDFNYQKASDITGQDFVAEPWRVESFEWAVKTATIFWEKNGCSDFADDWDITGLTRRINGGTNHLKERIDYCNRFLRLLS